MTITNCRSWMSHSLDGKDANREAWHGYATSFDDYVIYPHEIVEDGVGIVVLGHTTGSHLDLPDEEERRLSVIWRATVRDGLLTRWQILEDTPRQQASNSGSAAHGEAAPNGVAGDSRHAGPRRMLIELERQVRHRPLALQRRRRR